MRTCYIFISLILSLKLPAQKVNLSIPEIVQRSKDYYSHKNAGQFRVHSIFKSSIAESYYSQDLTVYYCLKEEKYVLEGIDQTVILEPGKYFYVDKGKRAFMDEKNRSFRKEQMERLNVFPQFNSTFFDPLKEKGFSLITGKEGITIQNLSYQYTFDTSDFRVLKFRNNNYSQYGLQIKEWSLLSDSSYQNCRDAITETNFLKDYQQVKTFKTIKQNPNLKGTDLIQLIGAEFRSVDGSTVRLDSMNGKYILLDVFYQSCMPCIQSFPKLKELYTLRDKLLIVGVDPLVSDSSSLLKFKNRYHLEHPLIAGMAGKEIAKELNPYGIYPFFVLADSQGKIIRTFEAYGEEHFEKIKDLVTKGE